MPAQAKKSIDLTPLDQERLQRIVDHIQYTTGAQLKFGGAMRAGLAAWEKLNGLDPLGVPAGPNINDDPEGHQRWVDREIEKQLNPLEDS